ncbi:hypothetical protein JOD18_000406 [Gracilibacillus alcaliphilus]|nr:hypothetical protein [Gracilibacillus alcaliphilus]
MQNKKKLPVGASFLFQLKDVYSGAIVRKLSACSVANGDI